MRHEHAHSSIRTRARARGNGRPSLHAAAADLDDATEKNPVTPGTIAPAREQLGELLLILNRPTEALVEYEASLASAPRRLAGVTGAAKAAKLAGNAEKARSYEAELANLAPQSVASRR